MEDLSHRNGIGEPTSILDDMKYLETDSSLASVEALSSHVILPGVDRLYLVVDEHSSGYRDASVSPQKESCSCTSSENPEYSSTTNATDASVESLYASHTCMSCSSAKDQALTQELYKSTTEKNKADKESLVSTGRRRLSSDHQKMLVRSETDQSLTDTSKLCNQSSEAGNVGVNIPLYSKRQDDKLLADGKQTTYNWGVHDDSFEEVITCSGCKDESSEMSGGVSKDENGAIFALENASNSFLDNHPVTGSSTSKLKVHVRLKAWETSPSNTEDEKCRGVHGAACKDDQSGETPYPNFSESETSHLQHTCKCTATEASVVSPDENTTTDNSHQDLTVHSEILHSCRPCDECTVTKPYETLESASFKLFDELPHELFFKVLSYFSVHELCVIIAPVCRAWYEYSRSPVLWQYLDLSANPDIGSNQLCTLLERATLLKSLKLRGREQLSTCEIRMLKTCPFLNKIDLGFCDNVNCTILAEIVRCCEYLQVVNMEGCDLIDDRVAAQFPLLPCLKVLNLSHCTKMTDEAVVLIGQGCLLLEELNVDGIPWITDRAIKLLAAERSETMRAVYLDGAELTDESVMHLMRCPLLHTLSLSFCEQLTDRSLSMLQIANPLRHLRLRRGVEFSEDALCHFFACGTVQDLSFLDLSECSELVDEGVTNIAHRCHQLKQLALCWCWNVSDVGIEEIVEHCGQLKYLDIIGLDKVKGHCFSRIPEALPRLTFLDLRQCNLINDMMLIDLVKAKPDLDIINYYGVEVTPNMLS